MSQEKVNGKDLFLTYFDTTVEDIKLHKCKECFRSIKQDLADGYANLVTHCKTQHTDDYIQRVKAHVSRSLSGGMDVFVRKPSDKAKNLFGWMEWIVMKNLPLQSC